MFTYHTPLPLPENLVGGLLELRAAPPHPTLQKRKAGGGPKKSQVGPCWHLAVPGLSRDHGHTQPSSPPLEGAQERDSPPGFSTTPPPPGCGAASPPLRPLQPPSILISFLPNEPPAPRLPLPASLAQFGGFCVHFLGLSGTVPPTHGCGLGPPSPRAVPSPEEYGGLLRPGNAVSKASL